MDGRTRALTLTCVFAAATITLMLLGCAASKPTSGETATANIQSFDPTGSWEGTLRVGCLHFRPMMVNTRCGGLNRIALTMINNPSGLSGFYKCSFDTMDCLNQNDSGNFASAEMTGTHLAIRISMQDGSSCLYDGNLDGANRIKGFYACYQGGGLEERGRFEIQRSY